MTDNIEIIKDKVKKLLSLSKSDNENEAAAALEKANELISKYELDESALRFESVKVKSSKTYAAWRIVVANAVSWLYGCHFYRQTDYGTLVFTGEELDALTKHTALLEKKNETEAIIALKKISEMLLKNELEYETDETALHFDSIRIRVSVKTPVGKKDININFTQEHKPPFLWWIDSSIAQPPVIIKKRFLTPFSKNKFYSLYFEDEDELRGTTS